MFKLDPPLTDVHPIFSELIDSDSFHFNDVETMNKFVITPDDLKSVLAKKSSNSAAGPSGIK